MAHSVAQGRLDFRPLPSEQHRFVTGLPWWDVATPGTLNPGLHLKGASLLMLSNHVLQSLNAELAGLPFRLLGVMISLSPAIT
jgi:hypothetical protein